MALPYVVLSSSQHRLLAEAMLRALPDPAVGESAEPELLARGLEPDEVRADIGELLFLKLVAREAAQVSATDLGAAVHYRAAQEAAEQRLAAMALLAAEVEEENPRLARAVRRLVQECVSPEEVIQELRSGK